MKKKVFSKSMAWILSLVMIFGVFIAAPITQGNAITQADFNSKLSSLRSQYPNYSTWYDYFDGGHQCWGFARLIAYNVFGSHADSWSKVTNLNNVKAGDVLQYGNTSGEGHTVFVTSVSGNTITFVDCNGNGNYSNGSKVRSCGIKWDNTISKSASMFNKYSFAYRLVSPGFSDFPGTQDTSYAVPAQLNAIKKDNTYDDNGNVESGHWIDAGDSCYVEKVYTNGFCRVRYPAGSEQRWAYAKANVFNIPRKNSGFPGAEDTSYAVPVWLNANQKDNTYDDNGNMESGHWIDAGDNCYIEKVYTNGFCRVQYPAGSEKRWAYAKASIFSIPKKNSGFPGAEDTSYAVPVWRTAKYHDNTYDGNGNMESNRWIDEGDNCYIDKVYQNGFCYVEYPAGSQRRWAYAKMSLFDLPKTHNYTTSVVAATCTAQGYTLHKCSHCGDSYKDNYQSALGHSYQLSSQKDATCTANGEKVYKCSRCGVTKTEAVNATGHSYTTKVVAPTCTAQGYTLYTCSKCGNNYKDNYTNAKGHSFGSWTTTKEATCTDKGSKKRSCTSCGYSETAEIAATGHNYTTKVVAPTCTAQGYTLHTCSKCGNNYKDTYTNATGHNFGSWTTTKEATCTEKGSKTRKCQICGHSETAEIAATGHNYTTKVVAPTCTAQGYTLHTCSKCGNNYKDTYTNATGHNFGSWTTTKEATCTEKGSKTRKCQTCGHSETAEIAATGHSYTTKVVAPTCTAQGYTLHTCSKCDSNYKDTYTNAKGHNFGSWTTTKEATCTEKGSKTRKCQTCGHSETAEIAAKGHSYTEKVVEPTETEQGYTLHTCSRCGDNYKTDYTDPIGPPDPNAPSIVVAQKKAAPGSTVTVDISMKNNPGIVGFKFNVSYDKSVLTLQNAESIGIEAMFSQNLTDMPFIVSWENGVKDVALNGEIVRLTFAVKENAADGSYPITVRYDADDIYNLKEENIHFAVINGSVDVSKYMPGDINNDGKVNMKDVTRLHQYINGWKVTVVEAAVDVNGDGKVNMKDVTRLHQYINGWNVPIF